MPDEIMKIPCPVARDLMTLGESGRYADMTRPLLQRHLAECPACAKICADMARPAAVGPVSEASSAAFRASAREMRRKNPLRTLLKALPILLLAALLMGAGVFAFIQLYDTQFDVPMNQYAAALYQTSDGRLYLRAQTVDGAAPFAGMFVWNEADVSQSGVLRIECLKSLLEPYRGDRERFRLACDIEPWIALKDGKIVAWRYGWSGDEPMIEPLGEVLEIRKAYRHGDAYETIWRAGDEIPVSDEYAPQNRLTEEQIGALFADGE